MIFSVILRRSLRSSVNKKGWIKGGAASFSSSPVNRGDRSELPVRNSKVCILGATGTLGKQIAFYLKLHPCVSHLALYDDCPASTRLASVISQLSTRTKAVGYWNEEGHRLGDALDGSDLVIVTAGVPTPGTCSDHLYNRNADLLRSLCTAIVDHCPQACVYMVSNPECSLDIAKDVFEEAGTYDWTEVSGVSTNHVDMRRRDVWAVEEGTKHKGIEMFQGMPRDALAITYATIVFANDYLCCLNKCFTGFPFTASAYISQLKMVHKG